jgi:hypothetical protein
VGPQRFEHEIAIVTRVARGLAGERGLGIGLQRA